MRVVKEQQYGDIHVSLFFMNGKYLIKYSRGNLEQVYKLSEMDYLIRDENEAMQAASNLLDVVREAFVVMHSGAGKSLEKYML